MKERVWSAQVQAHRQLPTVLEQLSWSIERGEFDYFYADTPRYFWSLIHLNAASTEAAAQAARPTLATQYYSAMLAYPTSIGGGFWWYFPEEPTGTPGTNLQNAIVGVANGIY